MHSSWEILPKGSEAGLFMEVCNPVTIATLPTCKRDSLLTLLLVDICNHICICLYISMLVRDVHDYTQDIS